MLYLCLLVSPPSRSSAKQANKKLPSPSQKQTMTILRNYPFCSPIITPITIRVTRRFGWEKRKQQMFPNSPPKLFHIWEGNHSCGYLVPTPRENRRRALRAEAVQFVPSREIGKPLFWQPSTEPRLRCTISSLPCPSPYSLTPVLTGNQSNVFPRPASLFLCRFGLWAFFK